MDQIPWPAILGTGGGWAVAGGLIWIIAQKLSSGKWYPEAIIEMLERRIASLETQNKDLIDQNHMLLRESLPTVNAFFDKAREVAETAVDPL